MWRVMRRTLKRLLTREELWNENRERLRNLLKADPEENIVLWAWTNHSQVRGEYEQHLTDGTWSHLDLYRLRNRNAVKRFLAALG
jgi:hypothetical protein